MQPSEKKRSQIEVQLEFKFEAALKSKFEVIESEIEDTNGQDIPNSFSIELVEVENNSQTFVE